MFEDLPWMLATAAVVVVAGLRLQRRWERLRSGYRELELYADTLLQHDQGTILTVQGVINELSSDDPVRYRIEQVLTRAEQQLSKLREEMQPHCSKQQQDWMK